MKYTGQFIVAGLLLLLCGVHPVRAANCPPVPNTFVNGQNADANQVNANFSAIITCTNSNLLGAANNLSDVGSASASRTNLGLGTSAVENLGNNVADDGSGNLYSKSSLHAQVFSGTGTFTVPTSITSSSIFKITVVGGGGGGGSASGTNAVGGGGGSGGASIGWFSGLTGGQTLAVTVGAGGAGGNASAAGTSSVASPNSTTIMSCTGGLGGGSLPGSATPYGGGTNTCSVLAGSSGLTLNATQINIGGNGKPGVLTQYGGDGGENPFGQAGQGIYLGASGGGVGNAGGRYGTGGGGAATSSTSHTGGAGAAGEVIFEWVQ